MTKDQFWEYVILLVKILAVVGISQGTVAYLILVERKIAAWAQDRLGPNRVGPYGLIQPLVDGAKMLLKEDVTPGYVARPVYILAPAIAIIAATIGFAVVPFGPVGPTHPASTCRSGCSGTNGSTFRSRRALISAFSTSSRSAASRFTA